MKKLFVLSSVAAALMASGSAFALTPTVAAPAAANPATAGKQFNVSVRILPVCEVVVSSSSKPDTNTPWVAAGADIDFGEHQSNAGEQRQISKAADGAGIEVKCTKGTPYGIGLVPSNGNLIGQGVMNAVTSGNADTVPYTLHQDDSYNKAWGDTWKVNTKDVASGNGFTTADKHIVYAKIDDGELDKKADRYTDTVTVKVYW